MLNSFPFIGGVRMSLLVYNYFFYNILSIITKSMSYQKSKTHISIVVIFENGESDSKVYTPFIENGGKSKLHRVTREIVHSLSF